MAIRFDSFPISKVKIAAHVSGWTEEEEEVDYWNVSSFSMLFIGRSIDRRGMPTVLTLFQLGLCSFLSLNTKRRAGMNNQN